MHSLRQLQTRPEQKLQRVAAHASLAVHRRDGRSRVARLFQEGAAKIRMPAGQAGPLEAILINTAGGLTGGDRLRWEIEIGPGAAAVVTTQACEKVYKATTGQAEVNCRLAVGKGARLAWLPQETIVFDRSALARRLDIDMAVGSTALVVEAVLFGRTAHGERVEAGSFRDRWRVRYDGGLAHAEDFAVGPDIAATLARSAVASGGCAIATLLLIADDAERLLDPARAILGDGGGASFWRIGGAGKLLARLVAGNGYQLRKRLVPLIELLNGGAMLPKAWAL